MLHLLFCAVGFFLPLFYHLNKFIIRSLIFFLFIINRWNQYAFMEAQMDLPLPVIWRRFLDFL